MPLTKSNCILKNYILIGVTKLFGEVGVAATLGLTGVSLIILKSIWKPQYGELLRKDDLDTEWFELNSKTFYPLSCRIFQLEDIIDENNNSET